MAAALIALWREDQARGPEEPPRRPRRRRTGGPGDRSSGAGGPSNGRRDSLMDRIAPALALTVMCVSMTWPILDSFPSLDGREALGFADWFDSLALRRAPGALAVLAAVLLIYGGLQRYASRLVAFLAAMLLAAAPAAMAAAVQANGDGVTLLAAAMALLALLRALDPEAPERLWPSLSLASAVAAPLLLGDPSVLLAVLGVVLLLWRTEDRGRLIRLTRPWISAPALAALGAAAVWFSPGGAGGPPALKAEAFATGLLALPLLLLPATPLLASSWLQMVDRPFSRLERIALAMICGPLLALIALPWRAWPIGLAMIPAVSLFAGMTLADERRDAGGPGRLFRRPAVRVGLAVWTILAGGLALALLTLPATLGVKPNAAVALSAVGALCGVALGALWGWQGKADRLALASVLASSLLCAGAMEAVMASSAALGLPIR